MPLASLFNLQWYGPESNAVVISGLSSLGAVSFELQAEGTVSTAGTATALTTGIGIGEPRPVVINGVGSTTSGQKVDALTTVDIRVNQLSQDDVTGAVLESFVEGDVTLKQALRLLLAHAAGDATGLDSTAVTFKSLDGSKTRIEGDIIAGERTITARDPT
jgi:hypothetical protein